MRKPLIALTLLITAVFATGYVIGQVRGAPIGSAASSPPNQPQSSEPWGGFRVFGHFGGSSGPVGTKFVSGPHAAGQVTAINGNTITIKPDANDPDQKSSVTTIVLTGSTQYFAGPQTTASKASIKVGSFIFAVGTLSSDGKTLTASHVGIAPNGRPGKFVRITGPHVAGQVTAVNGNTITIKPAAFKPDTQNAATTVVLTNSTLYFAAPDAGASKSSIRVGSFIVARGTLSSDGKTLTATHVIVLPSAPSTNGPPFGGFGSRFQGQPWQDGSQPSV